MNHIYLTRNKIKTFVFLQRYGFNTPPNYNDHELYCGGFTRQYQTNNGKCGICGDPWDAPQVSHKKTRPTRTKDIT